MEKAIKKRNPAKTRKKILDTASRWFGKKGYADTSMRDIADSADIRAATMYHYFSSKETLMREIFVTYYQDLAGLYRDIRNDLPGTCALTQALRIFMSRHRGFLAAHRDPAYLFFLEGLRPGTPLARQIKKMARESTSELKELARKWPALPGERVLTLLMGVVSMNIFFQVAGKYLMSATGITLPSEEQARTLGLLLENNDLEDGVLKLVKELTV